MTLAEHNRRTCSGKIKHSDETTAMEHMNRVMPNKPIARMRDGRRGPLNIYICGACGYMHVGHETRWVRKLRRENALSIL